MAVPWIIGEAHPDFAEAVQWLERQAKCRFFLEPAAALHDLHPANGSPPSAMILLQTRSGQFRDAVVEQLYSAAPLTPLVGLCGPWCEGESRSGRPLAGVTRIPLRAWRERLPRELAGFLASVKRKLPGSVGIPADPRLPLALPRTASDTERIEASFADVANHGRFGGTAVVCTATRSSFEAIGDMLEQWGMTTQWYRALGASPPRQGDVLICDGWDHLPSNRVSFPAPTLLLLHFPRPDDEARVRNGGIAAVVAQPLLLADFTAALGKALANGRRPQGDTKRG
jgi:hypothetical protein